MFAKVLNLKKSLSVASCIVALKLLVPDNVLKSYALARKSLSSNLSGLIIEFGKSMDRVYSFERPL